jgi:hypothetical protein
MNDLIRYCKCCHKPIDTLTGRRDRLFCNDGCRNKYHNTQNWMEEQEIKRIQLILKKNRRILKKLFAKKDHDAIDKERLLKEGFEFDYHTHFVVSKIKGNTFTFNFYFGYRKVDSERYKIVKAFENKEDS